MGAPELNSPTPDKEWAMVSDHPYYTSVDYFATEEEAIDAAREEITDMHSGEEGHHDSRVFICRVSKIANIKTLY